MTTATRELFLADRRRGIGGSDVACLLGLDPRKTPYQLWREKVGLDQDEAQGAALRRGNFLEPALLQRYAAMVQPAKIEPGIAHQADGGWRRGNQDARATMSDGCRRVVEGKTVRRQVFRAEWGTPWSDEVPDRALCQGLWYGNLDDGDLIDWVVCVVPDDPDEVMGLTAEQVVAISDVHIFTAGRNQKIECDLIDHAHTFWHQNVLARVAPDPEFGTGDAELMWPRHLAGKVKSAEPVADVLTRYAKLGQLECRIKEARQEARERLLLYAEDAEALVSPNGSPLLTLKAQDRAAYQVAPSTSRVLRLTKWFHKANPTAQPNLTSTEN